MAVIPLGVFAIFIVSASGGPRAFVHNATMWLSDAIHYCVRWVQSLS